MGRAFVELCRWKGCLPSELYDVCNPTIGDLAVASSYYRIKTEEEWEKIKALAQALAGGR